MAPGAGCTLLSGWVGIETRAWRTLGGQEAGCTLLSGWVGIETIVLEAVGVDELALHPAFGLGGD